MTGVDAAVPAPSGARIAVTGAGGRLGSALVRAAGASGATVSSWRRPDYDLDHPGSAQRLIDRDEPTLVIHSAAWTDVDGCARDPALAHRRNGDAVGVLADACLKAGVGLALISTNEVFDGERADGRGYTESDDLAPRNPYGQSKLAGELAARSVFRERDALWIVRTAWLYGPPGDDFPHKILAAADRLPADDALSVVADEYGSPTFTEDLAPALLRLVWASRGGSFHLVAPGAVSRLRWAEAVLARRRPGRTTRAVGRSDFRRASDPPPWGVLDPARASSLGVSLRSWEAALDDYLSRRD
jgi:dTDP-4-dehydrorhamnose reductase